MSTMQNQRNKIENPANIYLLQLKGCVTFSVLTFFVSFVCFCSFYFRIYCNNLIMNIVFLDWALCLDLSSIHYALLYSMYCDSLFIRQFCHRSQNCKSILHSYCLCKLQNYQYWLVSLLSIVKNWKSMSYIQLFLEFLKINK
jgi:hypothetical protein